MFQPDNVSTFVIITNKNEFIKETLGNCLQLPTSNYIYRFCNYRFHIGLVIKTGVSLVGDYEGRLWLLAYTCTIDYNFSTIPGFVGTNWSHFRPIQILLGLREENA
ncbi:MAG: hypothetical protein ACI9M1_001300 [Porticoccaceae bacterium]|jgi:hypothetical protein